MADDDAFMEEDVTAGGDLEVSEKTGFLPAIVLKILKWVGLGLLAIIFIVTVVVVVVRIMNQGNMNQSVPTVSKEYTAKPPILAWYDLEEMRINTADKPAKTLVVHIHLGREQDDNNLQSEIIQRTVRIQDIVRNFCASRTAVELMVEERFKRELKREINNVLSSGSIQDIVLTQFWFPDL